MKDLKENLFNETLRAFNRVRLAVDKYGLPIGDLDRERDHAVFCALYSLIEISDLEAEYQQWKQKEGEHSVVD